MKVFDYFVVFCVIAVLIICFVVIASGQDTGSQQKEYTYQGWQHGTVLNSNTWNAEKRPPQPNERLYIYRDGIKDNNSYYEFNGHGWQPKGNAYYRNIQEEDN